MTARSEPEQESNNRHKNESSLLPDTGARRRSDWIAAVILVVTFSIAEGISGGVAGLITVGVWFRLGTPYALATGIVFVTAQTSNGVASISVLLVGGGLLALLLAPIGTIPEPNTYAITVLFTTAALGSLTWILVAAQPLWLATIVLLGAGVLVTYGLYRYQRLRLGLLGDEQPDADESAASPTTSETETP